MKIIPKAVIENPSDAPESEIENRSWKLWKRLTYTPHTSGSLRNTIPPEFVRRFMEIMTSPEAVEVDWLMLLGHMDRDQASQYWDVLGARAECEQLLMDLAVDIADYFRPKLPQLVLNDIKRLKQEGIGNVFAMLNKLFLSRVDAVSDLQLISAHLGECFIMRVLALMGSDLIVLETGGETSEEVRREIVGFLRYTEDFFRKTLGSEFIGIQFYNEQARHKRTLGRHGAYLDAAIGFLSGSDDRSNMVNENAALFQGIRRESSYKKIPLVTLRNRNPQIIVVGEDPVTGFKCMPFCSVRINFNEGDIGFPQFRTDPLGTVYADYNVHIGVINLGLNPVTGDLCFITGGVPFSGIVSEDRYLSLQNYVFRGLLDYLRNKDPDIEDLFVYSPTELAARRDAAVMAKSVEEPLDVSERLHDRDVPDALEDTEALLWPHYTPFLNRKAVVDDLSVEHDESVLMVLPKHLRMVVMNRISGANAGEILAALRRMLGNEEKTQGSHLFFRSDRTKALLPVPRHSQKDKHHISSRLLLNNLAVWGYSPMEFAEELGADIPERIARTG